MSVIAVLLGISWVAILGMFAMPRLRDLTTPRPQEQDETPQATRPSTHVSDHVHVPGNPPLIPDHQYLERGHMIQVLDASGKPMETAEPLDDRTRLSRAYANGIPGSFAPRPRPSAAELAAERKRLATARRRRAVLTCLSVGGVSALFALLSSWPFFWFTAVLGFGGATAIMVLYRMEVARNQMKATTPHYGARPLLEETAAWDVPLVREEPPTYVERITAYEPLPDNVVPIRPAASADPTEIDESYNPFATGSWGTPRFAVGE